MKKYILLIFTILLSITLFSGNVKATKRDITKTTLENGMVVIVEEEHSSPVVSIQMWVQVGSGDEAPSEAGLSHVFEHMLFKGTGKRAVGDIAREVDEAGGNINAYTSTDNTVYLLNIASRYFDKGLDILSDAVQNSTFDKKELAKELEVVLEELRMGKDNPARTMFTKLMATAFKEHSYKNPVIGYKETITSFTRDDMIKFFNKWYIPNNMTLVITGNIDKNNVLKKIKESFKDFKSKPSPHKARIVEPKQDKVLTSVLRQNITKPRISFGFHIPRQKHVDTYAIDVLSEILGSGATSRFYKKVKKELDLVYGISTYAMTPKDPGLFMVYATLERDKIEKATKEIFKVIFKLASVGPTEVELDKAKLSLESDFIYGRETMSGRARQLGSYETISGGLDFESKYIEGVKGVSKDDIKTVITKYFTKKNTSFSAIIPEKEKQLKEKNVKNLIESSIKLAQLDNIPQSKIDKPITKTKLKNGITLIVEENHSNSTVAFYLTFNGGLLYETKDNNGIGNYMAGMLKRGTKDKTMLEFAQEVESLSGSLNGFSGKNSAGVSGRFLSKYFNKGITLASEIILTPSFDNNEMSKLRHDIQASIKMQEDRLPSYTFKLLNKEYFSNHPYSMPKLGSLKTVNSIKRYDLVKHHRRIFNPKNMVITVVGDIDSEHVLSKVTALFGDMKNNKVPKVKYKRHKVKKGINLTGDKKDKEQTHIGLAFPGVSFKNKDKYAIDILTEVLAGMGGRLFVELRDVQSLAYSVTAFSQQGIDAGAINLYIGCATEKQDQALEGLLSELKKITKDGITKEELARAKSAIIGGYEIGLQSPTSMASTMSNNELQGLGYNYHNEYPKLLELVTLEDVLKVAQKYLTLDSYSIAIVGANYSDATGK